MGRAPPLPPSLLLPAFIPLSRRAGDLRRGSAPIPLSPPLESNNSTGVAAPSSSRRRPASKQPTKRLHLPPSPWKRGINSRGAAPLLLSPLARAAATKEGGSPPPPTSFDLDDQKHLGGLRPSLFSSSSSWWRTTAATSSSSSWATDQHQRGTPSISFLHLGPTSKTTTGGGAPSSPFPPSPTARRQQGERLRPPLFPPPSPFEQQQQSKGEGTSLGPICKIPNFRGPICKRLNNQGFICITEYPRADPQKEHRGSICKKCIPRAYLQKVEY